MLFMCAVAALVGAARASGEMVEVTRFDMDWLIAPSSSRAFFATQYQHQSLRASSSEGRLGLKASGMGDAGVRALRRKFGALRRPHFRAYHDGLRLAEGSSIVAQPRDSTGAASTIAAALAGKESIVLDLDAVLQSGDLAAEDAAVLHPLQLLQANLEQQFLAHVSLHLYLSAPGADVLTPHADPYDVFILQLEGTKRWHVCVPKATRAAQDAVAAKTNAKAPLSRAQRAALYVLDAHAEAKGDGCTQFTHGDMLRMEACESFSLSPGEVLYLPKGYVHVAHTGEAAASTHVTIGVERAGRRWRELIAAIVHRMPTSSPDHYERVVLPALDAAARSSARRLQWNALVPLHALACGGADRASSDESDERSRGQRDPRGREDREDRESSSRAPRWCVDFERNPVAVGELRAVMISLLRDLASFVMEGGDTNEALDGEVMFEQTMATARGAQLLKNGVADLLDNAAAMQHERAAPRGTMKSAAQLEMELKVKEAETVTVTEMETEITEMEMETGTDLRTTTTQPLVEFRPRRSLWQLETTDDVAALETSATGTVKTALRPRRLIQSPPRRRLDCDEGKNGQSCGTGVQGSYYALSCDWCCCGACNSECDTCGGCTTWQQCSAVGTPTNCEVPVYTSDRRYWSTSGHATATYTCKTGHYRSAGDAYLTCNTAGSAGSNSASWSGSAATCSPQTCPTVTTPLNGAIVYGGNRKYSVGTVTYTCGNGYIASSGTIRYCSVAGTGSVTPIEADWDGIAPDCDPAQCPTLTTPSFGQPVAYVGVSA
jgi:hypothetical protein